jgi:exopolysaccharide biosynthesis polyprenyl glycosylphosphotransferase
VSIAEETSLGVPLVDESTLDRLAPRPTGASSASSHRRRGALVTRSLLLADVVGLALAFFLTELLFGSSGSADELSLLAECALFFATLPVWISFAKLYRLYDHDEERADHTTLEDFPGVFHLVTVGTFFLMVGSTLTGLSNPLLEKLAAFWALAIAVVVTARITARAFCRRSPQYRQNTLIVGAGQVGQLVARKLRMHDEYGLNLLGFVDAAPLDLREDLEGLSVLGGPDTLPDLVRELRVDRVVIAFSSDSHDETLAMIASLREHDVQVDIVPRFFEGVGLHTKLHSVESLPLLGLPTVKRFPFSPLIKRALDIAGASVGLALAAPFFAFAAWRISRESTGPVLFRQTRIGRDMREFTMLKFRTMRCDADDAVHREYIAQTMSSTAVATSNGLYKLQRDDAVTRFGRFLRKTSLDELPQLINVLRGDMSLVGPRPCLGYETEHFKSHHYERFQVHPGVTGLWQVSARAHATFGEALEMDVTYARNWSLGLDLWLLFRTPLHLLRLRGTA